MPTQTFYFSGEALYPHLNKPDNKFSEPGVWHISVILDEASKAAYAASGIQVKPKDYEGQSYIKFSRPTQKLMRNELVIFEPPAVVDGTGTPVTDLVGNKSKVTVKVSVFDTMRGKGHRLESIRVDELVVYKPEPKAEAPAAAGKASIPF